MDTPAPPEYDAFISYRACTDLPRAQELYDRLTEEGFRVWFDRAPLEPE